MENKNCAACGQPFKPCPRTQKHQTYCSATECQRERKRRWQRDKLKTDADYRDNQAQAQQAWLDRNPEYWREYRDAHPEYVKRNRDRQWARNNPEVVKMDAIAPMQAIPAGVYLIRPVVIPGVAKMDVITAEIIRLSDICP
jgi:hypothetical protein